MKPQGCDQQCFEGQTTQFLEQINCRGEMRAVGKGEKRRK